MNIDQYPHGKGGGKGGNKDVPEEIAKQAYYQKNPKGKDMSEKVSVDDSLFGFGKTEEFTERSELSFSGIDETYNLINVNKYSRDHETGETKLIDSSTFIRDGLTGFPIFGGDLSMPEMNPGTVPRVVPRLMFDFVF